MNQRISQFLAAENITQAQFAQTLSVAKASVSHVLSGRNNPGYDFIRSIAEHYPTLSLDWLITGKGKMYRTDNASSENHVSVKETQSEPEFSILDDDFPMTAEIVETPAPRPMPTPTASTAPAAPAPQPVAPAPTPVQEQTPIHQEILSKGRSVAKIIVFYDDFTYQELK